MNDQKTSQKILSIARKILAADGLAGVSFDAIARRLGRSKQAVLYWYPTKRDLLVALYLPWLEAETKIAEDAVAGASGRTEAVSCFVRAVVSFHIEDLDRFRMMYLAPQTTREKAGSRSTIVVDQEVYAITSRLYGALASHLDGTPEGARKQAVAIHSAALGLVLMLALADSMRDPLKHTSTHLIDALVASLTTSSETS
ncbi:MAG: TetR/AcrR family transcriptional regulator [Hoeflea sp.]|uniref:TetR/AcrR family transcriptional regulator n=1 Tax=Hoeflea sp. TaxID=1940281 RepID=UPI003EF4CB99